jgi:oligopeptide/dipeptide ABC transporter ATP-binding protein
MYLGKFCETGPAGVLLNAPAHPYTAALLSAIPQATSDGSTKRIHLRGEMPSPMQLPSGCHFRSRCPAARSRCAEVAPQLQTVRPGHDVACHFPYAIDTNPTKIKEETQA